MIFPKGTTRAQRDAYRHVNGALTLTQQALDDIARGDRIDALDSVRLAKSRLDDAHRVIKKALEVVYGRVA
jgi:hypothetical protein